ncbi:MAG: glycosyltransferase family 4 protein [Nitrospira sp.]|nr:glycosyltransferase family 4 protein [Nitrospira sp.]
MKVLWLGHNIGYPPKGGALQRNYNLIREVASQCELHLLAFDQPVTRPVHITPEDCVAALSKFCASVDWVPLRQSSLLRSRYGLAIQGLVSREPYDFLWLKSEEMARKLTRAVKEFAPDVIHFDALGLAQYHHLAGHAGTILTHHDVESSKIGVRAKKAANPLLRRYFELESLKLASAEQEWCPRFGANVVVSEDEGAVLSRVCPGLGIRVVPNGVDTSYFTPRRDPGGNSILFCGSMDMHPNQEAMEYFLQKIWPRLSAHSPDVNLCVAGRNPPEWLVQLGRSDARIHITGFVDDVRSYFQKAAVCICPILSGGGTRLKILDSLAMGVPVVATSFAASGLSLRHNEHLLLADSEDEFARAILELLGDQALRVRLSRAGADRVHEVYSWAVVAKALIEAYEFASRNQAIAG